MDLIYPISYITSLAGLVVWFFVQGDKKLSRTSSAIFLTSFLVYLVALTFATAETQYKFLILFRDLMVMAVVSQLFNIFKRSKVLSIVLALAVGLTLYFSYFNTLSYTFPQLKTEELDPSNEFLAHMPDFSSDEIDKIGKSLDCEITRAFTPASGVATSLDDYYAINAIKDTRKGRKRLYSQLERIDGIEWIEPNEVLELSMPEMPEEENVHNATTFKINDPRVAEQWGLAPLQISELHKSLQSSGVRPAKVARIAIVDSGVDAKHEDLKGNYVSSKSAYDSDQNGHGTHCAGVAAAVSNNGIGIASISPGTDYVQVTGYKVMNSFGVGTQKKVIQGIIEAVDDGNDVISLSLGGPTQHKKEKAYREVVRYAEKHNAIVVVAAGNNKAKANTVTPANVEGVIAVAAVNEQNGRAFFSNSVEDIKMGLSAPGKNVLSTVPGNGYRSMNGTSMATPHVAGLIGLMRAFRPELTTEEAFHILNKTGKKTSDASETGILIQPLAAVNAVID